MPLQRYRRKPDQGIIAVQLRLDTPGFSYRKWGASQYCNRADWLVDNNGEIYTVDAASFARTYREVRRGTYVKITPVWAEPAQEDGTIATLEGGTAYSRGDYLVYNNANRSDGYAMNAARFLASYEPDE